jgi:hypothetical protein
MRLQSAMEYLMTYGWAILIIAVVLGVLFQLGVFSSSSFSVRAPPGACQVFKPNGPGTSQNINLVGMCSGQLPQYVAQFNGQNSRISGPNAFIFPMTVTMWIKPTTFNTGNDITTLAYFNNNNYQIFLVSAGSTYCGGTTGSLYVWNTGATGFCASSLIPALNAWSFVAFTANTNSVGVYLNAQTPQTSSGINVVPSQPSPWYLGSIFHDPFGGLIANVQVYNSTLSASDIQTLYLEGIGGAPVIIQNLVGWWPLNGDAKDYSGNNNRGAQTSITFTSQYGK